MTTIHCTRKDRRWLTYCGLSLENFSGKPPKALQRRDFGFHSEPGAFLSGTDGQEFDQKCLRCLRGVRVERKREILAAVKKVEKNFPQLRRRGMIK